MGSERSLGADSRDFCAGLPPRRERPRHRTAEHTEKCPSLHVQPQAQEKASRRNDKNEHFGRGLEWTSGIPPAARPMINAANERVWGADRPHPPGTLPVIMPSA